MNIRSAKLSDQTAIPHIHLQAFGKEENELIATLATDLLNTTTTPETVHYVAEEGETPIGHVVFSPIYKSPGGPWLGYMLAPLGVDPSHQRKGVGSALVNAGLEDLKHRGNQLVIVYGDPAYYGRFGFTAEAATPFLPPFALQYAFGWQAINQANTVESPTPIQCVAPFNKPELW